MMIGQRTFENERDRWLLYEMRKKIIARTANDSREYVRMIKELCKELNI